MTAPLPPRSGIGPGGLTGIIAGSGVALMLVTAVIFQMILPPVIDVEATPEWMTGGDDSAYATEQLYVELNEALAAGDRDEFMKHVSGDASDTMTLYFDNMDALGWTKGAITTSDFENLLTTPDDDVTLRSILGVDAGFTASAPRGSGDADAGLTFIQGFQYDVTVGMDGDKAVITDIAAVGTTLPWLEEELYVVRTDHTVVAGYPAESALVDQVSAAAEPAAAWVLTTLNTEKDPLPLAGFTVFASENDSDFSSWFNSDDLAQWKMEIAGTAFPTYRPDLMTGVDPLIATGVTTSTGVVTIGPLAMDQLDGTLAHEFVHVAHLVQVPSGFGDPPIATIEGYAAYMETLYVNGGSYPAGYSRLAQSLAYADPAGAVPTDDQLRGTDAAYYYELATSRYAYAAANGYNAQTLANFSKRTGLEPIVAAGDLDNGNTLSDAGWLAWAQAN